MNIKDHSSKIQIPTKPPTRTVLSRSTTPNVSSARTIDPKLSPQIKIEYKKPETPPRIPTSEPPYTLMRNGMTFLYTPGQTDRYFPSLLASFGTPLRGSKVKGRNQTGNMFALHSNDDLRYPGQSIKPRSCLTMRFKWK